jgi:hypothetical protein
LADEHPGAVVASLFRKLGQESRFAHTGIAPEEHEARMARTGVRQEPTELGELLIPAYQRRAAEASRHPSDHAIPYALRKPSATPPSPEAL